MLLLPLVFACTVSGYVQGRGFDRFLTIWLENQDFSKVEPNNDMAELAKQGILLTNYYGLTHPSQPNYIASVGGDFFGLDHDDFVRIPDDVSTLVDLFDEKGISWRGYFEGIPGPGYMGVGSTENGVWDYVRKHNPFVSYDNINCNGSRLANILSLDDFKRDLQSKRLPQYAHISPDMLNDGHNTTLEFAASWSKSFLTPLLANDYFMENTLILLTYDESETYSQPNHIVSILLGGAVPSNLKGTTDDTFYTHYSILSTLENNWELSNLGRYDVGANVFKFLSDKTGYVNKPAPAHIDFSKSYPGPLNHDPATPYPPPNLNLIGAGGKGVSSKVLSSWKGNANTATPYSGSGDVFDFDVPPPPYVSQASNGSSGAG